MTTATLNPSAAVEAEQIVAGGTAIRARLTEVVARAAERSQQAGEGLLGLAKAVLEGAQEGLAKSVPPARDDVLHQVVDALGDGFSQAALAARFAVEEAVSSSRNFAQEDLLRLRDDLQAVNSLFAEAVSRTLTTGRSLTATELSSVVAHAGHVKDRLGHVVGTVFDAIRRHPIILGKEGLQASVSVGRHAAGALFQALGGMLERAGQQLRRQRIER